MIGALRTRLSRLEARYGIGKRRVIMYEAPDDYPRADIDAFLREAVNAGVKTGHWAAQKSATLAI